ncbi:hypothetical protein MNEG_12821 [Monoraphidium neglectum]|uniref:Uncharacterized protein n=1 Tax=Monoraphidium neglectum TaxID=145388 RepID=A0A0D2J5K5_9CHLO|nr:hypothetical protein MNEG_12821 [Monoraphidium neglectum]KIY95142.1 hypothetical protein MNEG_12821 [Monoraphidium neglectum]|eukprot:XP_013894162.1 hypothetical protein MNEG_12821 [Monoraphidium neglectum]
MIDLSRVDLAAIVFDSSDAASLSRAADLAAGVAEIAGESFPVVMIAAKADLDTAPELMRAAAAACRALALAAPLRVSVARGDMGTPNVFRYLAEAALHTYGHIPDTPARKLRRRNARRAWIGAGALAVAAAAGYATYHHHSPVVWPSSGSGGDGGSCAVGGNGMASSLVSSIGGALGKGFTAAQALGASAAALAAVGRGGGGGTGAGRAGAPAWVAP